MGREGIRAEPLMGEEKLDLSGAGKRDGGAWKKILFAFFVFSKHACANMALTISAALSFIFSREVVPWSLHALLPAT